MKHFTLFFALSIIICPCLAADSAFAQDAPRAQQTADVKDSRQSNTSVITINSNPKAEVIINNKRIGATPVSIAIEPGKHEFELINTENDIHIHKLFEVEAGKQASFNFNFDMECKHNESAIPKVLLNFLSPALVQKKSAKEKDDRLRSRKKGNLNRATDVNVALPF